MQGAGAGHPGTCVPTGVTPSGNKPLLHHTQSRLELWVHSEVPIPQSLQQRGCVVSCEPALPGVTCLDSSLHLGNLASQLYDFREDTLMGGLSSIQLRGQLRKPLFPALQRLG